MAVTLDRQGVTNGSKPSYWILEETVMLHLPLISLWGRNTEKGGDNTLAWIRVIV